MADLIVQVILAGGQGTRLWPLSRSARPKQFLDVMGDHSLFEQTLQRVADPERYVRVLAMHALGRLGKELEEQRGPAVKAILKSTDDSNVEVAVAAIETLGTLAEHLSGGALISPVAMSWLEARFAGEPLADECSTPRLTRLVWST